MNESLSAVEILERCPEYSNGLRQSLHDETFLQVIKQRLNSYNSLNKPLFIDKDDSIFTIKHDYTCRRPGRSSSSLIIGRNKRIKDSMENDDKLSVHENLRIIGRPKSRRSFRRKGDVSNSTKIDNAFGNSQFSSPERIAMSPDVDLSADLENQEKAPSDVSEIGPLQGDIGENWLTGEKLIPTPVKAQEHSISPHVEYDRVSESMKNTQTEPNCTLDGVQLDNLELIDEILTDKIIADLMSDDEGRDKENLSSEEICESKTDKSNSVGIKRKRRYSVDSIYSPSEEELESNGEIIDNELSLPLSGEFLEKLRMVVVKFEHTVPPQHKIEKTTMWKPLTPQEKQRFKKYSELKESHFDPKEDEILKNNWVRFCEIHGLEIPKGRFFQFNHNGKIFIKSKVERIKFVQFLANGLPCRSLRAVFQRFKILYGYDRAYSKKRYTESDDERIMKYMESRGTSRLSVKECTKMRQYFQRPYTSILGRYKTLQNLKERDQLKLKKAKDVLWTLELMETFLKHLIDLTMSENVSDLKDAVIPAAVWKKMQARMNIEFSALKGFWLIQFHTQLFATRPIFFNEIKIMIIEYLYQKGIVDTREIDWSDAVKYFDGCTTHFLRKMCPRFKDNGSGRGYGDLIEDLYEKRIPILKNQKFDSYLPRLAYSNGKLEIIDNFSPE